MRLHHDVGHDVGSICHVTPDFLRHFTTAFMGRHMCQIAPNVISRDLAPLERSLSEARLPTGRL